MGNVIVVGTGSYRSRVMASNRVRIVSNSGSPRMRSVRVLPNDSGTPFNLNGPKKVDPAPGAERPPITVRPGERSSHGSGPIAVATSKGGRRGVGDPPDGPRNRLRSRQENARHPPGHLPRPGGRHHPPARNPSRVGLRPHRHPTIDVRASEHRPEPLTGQALDPRAVRPDPEPESRSCPPCP